ncbi:hypothetical protein EON76_03595 [bacterium]|nr:MAG: hypothetical protein EON76_03595 [bacterium]
MSEFCPLSKNAAQWLEANSATRICTVQCESLWEKAYETQESTYDDFGDNCGIGGDEPCGHAVEFAGSQIEHVGGRLRAYSILNSCMEYGTELYSETVLFECPHSATTE